MTWQAAAILGVVVLFVVGAAVYMIRRATQRTANAEADLAIERAKTIGARARELRDAALAKQAGKTDEELLSDMERIAERGRKDRVR